MALSTHYLIMMVGGDEVFVLAGEDLAICFYLCELPGAWIPWFTFEKLVEGAHFRSSSGTSTRGCLRGAHGLLWGHWPGADMASGSGDSS